MSNLKARFLFPAGVKIAPVKGTRLERFSLKRIGKLLPSTGQDDAPPISFSPCRRKRNAHLCAKSRPSGGCAPKRRCGGRRPVQRKRGAGSRLGGSRLSSLAAQVIRTSYELVQRRHMVRRRPCLRLCSAWEVYGTEHVFCCASFAWVYKGWTAANLLRCASLFAVAAQCAGGVIGCRFLSVGYKAAYRRIDLMQMLFDCKKADGE